MTTYTVRIGIVSLLFSAITAPAFADYSITEQLQKFKRDSKNFSESQESVQKYELKYEVLERDKNTGEPIKERLISETPINIGKYSPFSKEDRESFNFVEQKNARHEGFGLKDKNKIKSRLEAMRTLDRAELDKKVDNPATLVEDGIRLQTLEQMDKDYRSATLKQSPWSGDYWAIYSGGLAKRYSDPGFNAVAEGGDWREITNYITTANATSLDDLSPAEKYDILIGDNVDSQGNPANKTDLDQPGWGLTKAMLREGRSDYQENGKVETWMGHCHGWAPAAYMERRPHHKIEVMAADGRKLTFYPSDIKALASLMWAQANTETNFVGTRCNIKNPETDANGRILDQSCFDTNPGTWHKAVVNQIGYYKKSFVLDATYDFEVWNQPAYAYEYKYFNPLSGEEVRTLDEARIPATKVITGSDGKQHATFEGDKFSNYRSDKTKYFVGIAMKFTYIAETPPSKEVTEDSQDLDRRVAVHYLYDLELDANKNIIGGEWYHVQHPDFLWSPTKGSKALSAGDESLNLQKDKNHWKLRHAKGAPKEWRSTAIEKSSPNGQPLTRIVKELIQKSNQIDFEFFGPRHWNRFDTGVEERY